MNARFARIAYLLAPLVPLMAACGGFDASQTSGRHNVVGATDPTAPAANGTTSDPPADPAAGGGTDPGVAGGGTPGSANAFTGAAAFVSQLGRSTRKSDHNFPGNNPPTSPMGQACANCHNFFMGGTVFADAAGTKPAAGVEVRARNAAGVAVSAWTDQDGNFYMPSSGGVTLPSSIGVRNTTTTMLMSSSVATGACASSSCHVDGKQGPIHLP